MRIAVSGTHFSGKSTLIASLLKELPNYTSVDEPYLLLEQDGYEFSDPPCLEDFELQMKLSIKVINESRKNTIFDRSPLDFLAYAVAIGKSSSIDDEVDTESWVEKMYDSIQLLDLILYVPIESPDRILVPISEDLPLRRNVDEKLHEILLNDSMGILENTQVLEVRGNLENRVKMVRPKVRVKELI